MSRHAKHRGKIEAAPPCGLRLNLTRPRTGLNLVPSNSRPNLFGGD
ncbi:MAG: hypothetical protein LAO06_03810 [Acidobacteriia bacterium]|nr:hypothetical protein [Terriglobia bacterium]